MKLIDQHEKTAPIGSPESRAIPQTGGGGKGQAMADDLACVYVISIG
jgi:hypothetical protein